MTLFPPLQEETYSVSALCEEVRDLLRQAWAEVWVVGEVNRTRQHRSGHFYFELVEKGERDQITAKLEAVAWRNDYQRIRQTLMRSEQEVAEGQTIRCRCRIDFYSPFGRLQLVVQEVDPVFTAGLLAERRRQTLAALGTAGLLERNRGLPLSEVPLRLGLITSHGSAAYHDFLSSLRESGYGFEVLFVHAAVQGREAEREIVSALALLGSRSVDCVALIRGGGSRADLAVFDSREVAEAIARAPFPVLTGLGHEIDQTIADLVAHTSFKTPTKVAEFLAERLSRQDRRVLEVARSLGRAGLQALRSGRETMGRAESALAQARWRVSKARYDLEQLVQRLPRLSRRLVRTGRRRAEELSRRLAGVAPLALDRSSREPLRLGDRLATRAELRLSGLAERLSGWERLLVQLAPERTLERGFSITRDATGRVLRHPSEVRAGDRVTTELAGGSLNSRVEEA